MTSPREIAILILIKSEEGSYSNLALNRYLDKDLEPIDRAFVTELVYGVIQNKLHLDYVISQYSKIKPRKLSPLVLNALRLCVYQMIFLDKVPDFASVNESVNIVKKREGKRTANFTNAVLRNISRDKENISYPDKEKDIAQFLSIYYSFPLWMVRRWIKLYGTSFTEDLCKAFNERSKLCIRVNSLVTDGLNLKQRLAEEGVSFTPGLFLDQALYIEKSPPLYKLKSFKEGFFTPQDESSMLATTALGVESQDLVLDVAAAPGGKVTHIAEIMKNQGSIVAWDIHPNRTRLIKENCKRLGVTIVDPEVKDSRIPDKDKFCTFDKVLIDAPCSGLGVIRRKPDIKWTKKPEDIRALVVNQRKILEVCSNYVKPGGFLVYSTCSIDPEENEVQVEKFLRDNSQFAYDDLRFYLPQRLFKNDNKPTGYITLYPNIHGTDGFFMARLKRVKV